LPALPWEQVSLQQILYLLLWECYIRNAFVSGPVGMTVQLFRHSAETCHNMSTAILHLTDPTHLLHTQIYSCIAKISIKITYCRVNGHTASDRMTTAMNWERTWIKL
jgi:hypothetical protein